jgi:phosphoglycerate dehydrogenase-like enzyme
MDRLLVVDLAATSKNWALTPEGERRLLDNVPDGWRVHMIRAATSSDGDGPPRPSDEVMDAIREAEAYFGFGVPRPLFLDGKKLRWVHSAAAGVGTALYAEMVASDVLFTNSAGIHAIPIAEYVVAGVLHFLRGCDFALDQQRRGEWNKAPFVKVDSVLREMDTVRALIIGVGGLGGATAERLTALGATCTGVRRRVGLGAPPGFARVVGLDRLDDELPNHDVIVLAAPLTGETKGLLTAERLALLPASAIVVNVARGALLDDEALVERLNAGLLRGAVLDVFREEPLASTSPLWQLRQVLLTPHVSPVSPGRFWPRQLDLFLDNWRRYSRGEPLRNVVDKRAGY